MSLGRSVMADFAGSVWFGGGKLCGLPPKAALLIFMFGNETLGLLVVLLVLLSCTPRSSP
jgi:hypothetical protein